MRAEVPLGSYGMPEVVWPIRVLRLCGLLRVIPGPREIPVAEPGRDLVADNRGDGRVSNVDFPAVVFACPDDRPCRDFRLEGCVLAAPWRRRLRTQSNCGVFIAGSCTMVSRTLVRSCSSSLRSESQSLLIACLAAQYAD